MVSALALLSVALMAFGVLVYLGHPLSVAIGCSGRDPFRARTALLGVCEIQLIGWHWVTLTGRGLGGLVPVLLVVNAVPFAWAVRRTWRGPAQALRGAWAPLGMTVVVSLVFVRYYRDSLGGPALHPVSLGNNDLPYYALLAQHLGGHGFSDTGAVVGSASLGAAARNDVFGAFALLSSLSSASGLEVWRLLLPLMLLAVVLLAGLCAQLIKSGALLSWPLSIGIAVTAIGSSMFFYSVGQGFFAQLFGMALFAALAVTILESGGATKTLSLQALAELGLLVSGLLLSYPHMAFLGPPVLMALVVAPVVVRASGEGRRTRAQLLLLTTALLLACLVCATRTVTAWQRTFGLGKIVAGWGLPRVDVTQYLGLQLFPTAPSLPPVVPRHDLALASISWRTVAAVILCGAIVLLLVRSVAARSSPESGRAMAWALSWAAVPAASYYVFYGYFGTGYQQWKWLAFLQPFIVVGVLSLLAVMLAQGTPWGIRRPWTTPWLQGASVVAVLAATVSVRSYPHAAAVRSDLVQLRDDVRLDGSSGVNVRAASASPLWDGMWTIYFLQGRRTVPVTQTYFPVQTADPRYPTVLIKGDGGVEVLSPENP